MQKSAFSAPIQDSAASNSESQHGKVKSVQESDFVCQEQPNKSGRNTLKNDTSDSHASQRGSRIDNKPSDLKPNQNSGHFSVNSSFAPGQNQSKSSKGVSGTALCHGCGDLIREREPGTEEKCQKCGVMIR